MSSDSKASGLLAADCEDAHAFSGVLRGSPGLTLCGATVGFCAGFASVSLFGPTAGYFQEKLGLSPMQVSWLIAVPASSGSLLRIPCGAMVDSSGGRTPFLALLFMSNLGMVGLLVLLNRLDHEGDSQSDAMSYDVYPLLLAFGVLVGCGIAAFSVGIGQISYWFPQQEHGKAFGIYAGVGNLAPGAIAMTLPFLLKSEGIFFVYKLWLALLLMGTAVYVCLGRNAWYFQLRRLGASPGQARAVSHSQYGQEMFPHGGAMRGLAAAAATWQTWALVMVYFASFGGFVALTAWFPTYWTAFHGVAATTAGMLTAFFSMGASSARIAGGTIADKIGGEVTLLASTGLMCVGAFLLMVSTPGLLKIAFLGESILALGMGIACGAVFKLVPQVVPQAVGGAAGLVGGLGAFGGFAIPPMMGAFVSYFGPEGYSLGFSIFVALSCMAFLLAIALKFWMLPGGMIPIASKE